MNHVKILGVIALLASVIVSTDGECLSKLEDSSNGGDILIIVNSSVPDTTISMERIRTIFLRQRTYWGSGSKIFPINAKPDSQLREAFREHVLCMSIVDEVAWWRDEKIRNGLLPPAEYDEPQRAVDETRDGIGYVFRRNYESGSASIIAAIPTK